MRIRWTAVGLSVIGLVFGRPVEAQGVVYSDEMGARADTSDLWERDLEYLTALLPRVHGRAFRSVTEARFDSAAAALRLRLPTMHPSVVRAELAALVALVGDGHTRVNLLGAGSPGVPTQPDSGFVPLPVRPYWFADGVYVREARWPAADLAGARIVRVSGVPTDEALARLARFAHRDNEMTVRLLVPILMTRPAFLAAAGLTESVAEVSMELEMPDGRIVKRVLRATVPTAGVDDAPGWIDAADARGVARPLWRQRNDENYWFELFDDGRALYLQFNVVDDAEEETLDRFAGRLADFVAANPVERMVVDLRNNDGGNWVLSRPLIDAIDAVEVNTPGSLFVVVGRATFSAAGVVAALLEDRTDAVLVGEPTGARPNTWGDLDSFTLPGSGLSVSYSERFFQSGGPYDERPWVAPTITAEPTFAAYLSGRDPALEAVDRYAPETSLRERMLATLEGGGVDGALAVYGDYVARVDRRYYWAFDDLSAVGIHLWLTDRVAESLPVWRRMAADFPESGEGYENLAETYEALGDHESALAALGASLRIEPANGDALEVLQELCGHDAVLAVIRRGAAIDLRTVCR